MPMLCEVLLIILIIILVHNTILHLYFILILILKLILILILVLLNVDDMNRLIFYLTNTYYVPHLRLTKWNAPYILYCALLHLILFSHIIFCH
jgi:hypothetical protein